MHYQTLEFAQFRDIVTKFNIALATYECQSTKFTFWKHTEL